MTDIRFALVGDYKEAATAHQAIPVALQIATEAVGLDAEIEWIHTSRLASDTAETVLAGFDAIWCVPASPYASMDGALAAIRHAREAEIPFLGTCGGYQHAVLEFARNVLGLHEADNAEVNPDASLPLVAPLTCALIDQAGDISFAPDSLIAKHYGADHANETYRCSYGFARQYVPLFAGSDLHVSAWDDDGDPRAIEIRRHPFFIGTAFQPERSALKGVQHNLISAFVRAAHNRKLNGVPS
ncbi:hypothetical protein TH25_08720 [Thalassospira profundimaris]|uniref:CTP synthase (glutamine hydrolyzing) n=1 Tax=Thalassospira profundimaris TaxID=502049 RepID=A0A367XG55_9PROT|nr:gamma-glutamyl-gamma-aminobutyrate hydrolase family protein [Thalassospira profundimaris]RCK51741.1 hypothetical protein TH25_08720 [Thalassospira profundimaris]